MTETTPPLRLPRADAATIDPRKLKDYALNPDHERGGDKARVFESALGITQADWEYLRDQILEKLPEGEVRSIEPLQFAHAYSVTVWIDGRSGATQPVATRWVVHGDQPPWFTSCWVDI